MYRLHYLGVSFRIFSTCACDVLVHLQVVRTKSDAFLAIFYTLQYFDRAWNVEQRYRLSTIFPTNVKPTTDAVLMAVSSMLKPHSPDVPCMVTREGGELTQRDCLDTAVIFMADCPAPESFVVRVSQLHRRTGRRSWQSVVPNTFSLTHVELATKLIRRKTSCVSS